MFLNCSQKNKMKEFKKINISHIKEIALTLAHKTMGWDEPIPPFDSRYPNRLESCVEVPFQTYGNKDLYPTLTKKAAVLFYLMVKNHPFENGNKRIAVTTLLVFLYLNDKWLEIDQQELYNFAKWVASSPPKIMESTVAAIDEFINKYIVKI